jgi:RHS repeat-associated protein
VQNALGNITTTAYDAASRVRRTVNPLGNISSFAYDTVGRQVRTVNALGNVFTSSYDCAGRLTASVNPLQQRTSSAYDALGQQVAVRDANNKRTTTVYDPVGRVKATLDANGNQVTNLYDAAGQWVALADARGNRTSFAYDAAGRQVLTKDPLLRRTTLGYDAAGRQVQRTDARGYRTTYLYDDRDLLTGRKYPDGTRATFTYDAISERTVMSDSTGRTTSTFDADGRLATMTNPAGKRLTYGYDAIGERTRLIDPDGGLFTYAWDVAGRRAKLTNPEGQRTSWGYDAADRPTVNRLSNGTRASYSYDQADRLTRLVNLFPNGTTLSSFQYRLDPTGTRTRVVEATGDVVSWGYDNAYQLTKELRSGANAYAITYTYDGAGNRLTMRNSGAPTTYTYDAANELSWQQDSTGRTTTTYDANGNQLVVTVPAGTRTSYAWDFENRLTSVQLSSGTTDTFAYNADRKRVRTVDSAGTANFVWDWEDVLQEADQNQVTQVTYTLWPAAYGELVSQRRGSTTSYYHFDGLGSADRLTNASGTVTDSYVYQGFGGLAASNGGTANPYKWAGRQGYYGNADTAELYVRMRWYRSGTARWISRDPMELFAADANLYRYVGNAPPCHTDPSGLQKVLEIKKVWQPEATGDCGRAKSKVKWIINDKKAKGWIIQHVTFDLDLQDCDGKKLRWIGYGLFKPFWEAWEVTEGGKVWTGFAGKKDSVLSKGDTFTIPDIGNNTKGTFAAIATVKFMPNYKVTMPPWGGGCGWQGIYSQLSLKQAKPTGVGEAVG